MSKMISKFAIVCFVLVCTTLLAQAGKISAYYDAPFATEKTVKSKLKKAGFKVLASYSPASKENLKVIIFTNNDLKSNASKKKRGFAAIQRLLINTKAQTVRVTNPKYWLKAFMQKDYKSGVATKVKKALTKALGKLSPTKDVLDENELSGYHFMMAMPYYQDMLILKKDAKVNPKKKVFELKLENGSTLVGVKMSKNTENFIDKIGIENALLLPYTVLIEEGTVYALHAKYYLALSYPLLSMGEFMGISSIPDAIERKLKKSLK